MAVSTIKFTGDNALSGTHSSGSDIYWRSTAAADAGTVTTSGVKTTGTILDLTTTTLTASEGKVEVLTGQNWDSITHLAFSTARTGATTIYTANGTAASGTIHFHGLPADGDTVELGLTGFTKTATFKTTLTPSNDEILIGATVGEMADNFASWVNDASTGDTTTPVDGTDWVGAGTAPANANAYLTATVSGADVTLTDKISCERQLAWVLTATLTDSTDLSISTIRGGIDGTLLGTIDAGNSSISTSASSGIDLDDNTADTLPPGFTGSSKAVHTRGRFTFHLLLDTAASDAIASKLQISDDAETWTDAPTSTITDLQTDADQLLNGDDLFAEYARWTITSNASGDPEHLRATITSQS